MQINKARLWYLIFRIYFNISKLLYIAKFEVKVTKQLARQSALRLAMLQYCCSIILSQLFDVPVKELFKHCWRHSEVSHEFCWIFDFKLVSSRPTSWGCSATHSETQRRFAFLGFSVFLMASSSFRAFIVELTRSNSLLLLKSKTAKKLLTAKKPKEVFNEYIEHF
jgi:hypothetical protein